MKRPCYTELRCSIVLLGRYRYDMKISASEFLAQYKKLVLARTPGIAPFAYWKMKWLIENGETYHLPECDCYYMIRDKHLLMYIAPDNQMHLSADELNGLECISLPAALYDSVREHLTGFGASYYWGLKYDFQYQPKESGSSPYEAVDFDFFNQRHYERAAEMIGGDNGWFTVENVKKMTTYPAFDPSLWFLIKDTVTQDYAAISISAYDAEVKETDLDWIYVAPEYQGKGCGRFLIKETIRRCKNKSNNICVGGTVEFYRKCGFVNSELWVWAPKEGYQFKAAGIQP